MHTRSTDVTKINFPLQMVAAIVAAVLSAASVVWINQAGIKESQAQIQSDIRNLSTKMDGEAQKRQDLVAAQEKIAAAEAKAQDVRDQALRSEVRAAADAATKALNSYTLQGYDYKTLEGRILALERRKP